MLHDLRITAAQAAYLGEWVAQDGADVMLALDAEVLVAGQGDDRFLINPDGSEDLGCLECGRPEAAHAGEMRHAYEPALPDCTCSAPVAPEDPDHEDDCERGVWLRAIAASNELAPDATDEVGVPLFSAETQAESEPPAPDREPEAGGRGTTPSSSASGKDRLPTDVSRAAALDDARGERDR